MATTKKKKKSNKKASAKKSSKKQSPKPTKKKAPAAKAKPKAATKSKAKVTVKKPKAKGTKPKATSKPKPKAGAKARVSTKTAAKKTPTKKKAAPAPKATPKKTSKKVESPVVVAPTIPPAGKAIRYDRSLAKPISFPGGKLMVQKLYLRRDQIEANRSCNNRKHYPRSIALAVDLADIGQHTALVAIPLRGNDKQADLREGFRRIGAFDDHNGTEIDGEKIDIDIPYWEVDVLLSAEGDDLVPPERLVRRYCKSKNTQRENWLPFEEAMFYREEIDEALAQRLSEINEERAAEHDDPLDSLPQDEVQRVLKTTRRMLARMDKVTINTVKNRLKLLDLPAFIQDQLRENHISPDAAMVYEGLTEAKAKKVFLASAKKDGVDLDAEPILPADQEIVERQRQAKKKGKSKAKASPPPPAAPEPTSDEDDDPFEDILPSLGGEDEDSAQIIVEGEDPFGDGEEIEDGDPFAEDDLSDVPSPGDDEEEELFPAVSTSTGSEQRSTPGKSAQPRVRKSTSADERRKLGLGAPPARRTTKKVREIDEWIARLEMVTDDDNSEIAWAVAGGLKWAVGDADAPVTFKVPQIDDPV